jgi:hypothetical protein
MKFIFFPFCWFYNVQFREKSCTPYSDLQFKEFLDSQSKRQQLVLASLGYTETENMNSDAPSSNVPSSSQNNMNSDPFNVYSNNVGDIPVDVSSSAYFYISCTFFISRSLFTCICFCSSFPDFYFILYSLFCRNFLQFSIQLQKIVGSIIKSNTEKIAADVTKLLATSFHLMSKEIFSAISEHCKPAPVETPLKSPAAETHFKPHSTGTHSHPPTSETHFQPPTGYT